MQRITFYDIPSKFGRPWSPNTWKARFTLNYKGLPYETKWVEYEEIAQVYKDANAEATMTKRDGSPHYTVPLIHDHRTDKLVSDSLLIAQYLDQAYPDSPQVIQADSEQFNFAWHEDFIDFYNGNAAGPLISLVMPKTADSLNPPSSTYFHQTRTKIFGVPMKDFYPRDPVAQWAKVERGFAQVAKQCYKEENQVFITGKDKPIFADFIVFSFLSWIKGVWGEDSEEWNRVMKWQGGRWARLDKALQEYSQVV